MNPNVDLQIHGSQIAVLVYHGAGRVYLLEIDLVPDESDISVLRCRGSLPVAFGVNVCAAGELTARLWSPVAAMAPPVPSRPFPM
jgi:hypothetical protein